MYDEFDCHECGQPFYINDHGIAHHLDTAAIDGINHAEDADHVPYSLENNG